MFRPSRSWSCFIRQSFSTHRLGVQYFRRQAFSSRFQGRRPPPPPPPRYRRAFDPRVLLAFTSAAGFSFKEHGISDERLAKAESVRDEFDKRDEEKHGWEVLVKEPDFRAYRRRVEGPYEIYEYKCAGTYRDISPRTFLDAQNDLKYRHEWDSNIIVLEMLKEDEDHELLHWIAKYPYPMYPREYIYVRRTWVSDDEMIVVVESEVVPPKVLPSPIDSESVRVETYSSRMAIRAHSDWNEHGLDYILTYSDNPEANIPRYVYNWIVNQGGPYFLKQVHRAALEIEKSGREITSSLEGALAVKRSAQIIAKEEKEQPVQKNEEQCDIEIGRNEAADSRETGTNVTKESEVNVKNVHITVEEHEESPAVKVVSKAVEQVKEAVEKVVQLVKDELPQKEDEKMSNDKSRKAG